MIIELLTLLLIILIVLFLFCLLNNVHIHLLFENNNLVHNGYIDITYLFINLYHNINENILDINLKFKSHKKHLKTIDLSNKNDEEIVTADDIEKDDEQHLVESIETFKEYYPLLKEAKSDLLELIVMLTKLIKFEESELKINLGLLDNNLTIKLCNILWAITAPFYAVKFYILIIPEINQAIIKTRSNAYFKFIPLNFLRIIIKIITTKKLFNITLKLIRDLR